MEDKTLQEIIEYAVENHSHLAVLDRLKQAFRKDGNSFLEKEIIELKKKYVKEYGLGELEL